MHVHHSPTNTSSGCGYTKHTKTCVMGHNIVKYLNTNKKSLEECKALCDQEDKCVAIEYGVNYGGDGYPRDGDCLLQSSTNTDNCDGGHWNLDLYVKPEKSCGNFLQALCLICHLQIVCV